MDTIIFLFRLITIFFSIQYLIPFGDPEHARSVYVKAFIASGGSNLFRLYQRLSVNGFGNINQQFFVSLMAEDSLHYLLYCMAFPMATPVTSKLFICFKNALIFYLF